MAVLSRLRCHADVKHFKSFEDDDDGLNSEIGKVIHSKWTTREWSPKVS